MQIINFDKKHIWVRDNVSSIGDMKPIRETNNYNMFVLPNNYYVINELEKRHASYPLTSSFPYDKWKENVKAKTNTYNLMKKVRISANSITPELVKQLDTPKELDWLYDYQKVDAWIMSRRNTFANLNAMRSGKTPTTCASLHLRSINENLTRPDKVIISIIQATNLQWKKEIAKSCSEYKVFDLSQSVSKTKRKELWNAWKEYDGRAIMLINRDKIKLDVEFLKSRKDEYFFTKREQEKMDFGLVVDESHFLRNINTQISQSHIELSKKAQFRVALTGTKISNNGEDLYGLFKFLKPDIYTNKWEFLNRYFKAYEQYVGKTTITHYDEYDNDMLDELMTLLFIDSIERTEKEVMPNLPEYEITEPELIEMSKEHKKLYNELADTMEYFDKDSDTFISMPNMVSLRTKLLQASTNPALIFNKDIESPILTKMKEWLKDNPDRTPVFFGRFTNSTLLPIANELTKLGYSVGTITGQSKDKAEIADEFQNGKYDMLICNIVAAGTGLTLDRADTLIFIELDDNLANNTQAEKRIVATKKDDMRIKQINTWLVNGTIQLVQYASLKEKEDWVLEMLPDNMYKKLKIIYDLKGDE